MLMSVENSSVKRCSRCRCTLLIEQYFEKNRKGEYFKLCNTCRNQLKEVQGICKRCGLTYSLSQGGLKRHQRLWKCVSAICPSNNNYNEFAHWAVEFRSSLPKIYEIWGANGEAYLMKQNDKPIQA